jgi:hypothetical protein
VKPFTQERRYSPDRSLAPDAEALVPAHTAHGTRERHRRAGDAGDRGDRLLDPRVEPLALGSVARAALGVDAHEEDAVAGEAEVAAGEPRERREEEAGREHQHERDRAAG